MTILGYKNQNNMVGVSPRVRTDDVLAEESLWWPLYKVVVLVWCYELRFLHPVSPSFSYLFV